MPWRSTARSTGRIAGTYERWASSTPPDFAFSVKLPQAITHEMRLVGAVPAFDPFRKQVQGLGGRLRCLLVSRPA